MYLIWRFLISAYSFRQSIFLHKRLQLSEQSPNCQVPIVIISYVRLFLIKFYRRHSELVEKYNVSLRKLLQQGISEPEFYGDLVYRIRKIVGKSNCSEQFRKLINRYKRIGYNPYVMRQTACLIINPTSVDSYASLFNCTMVVGPQTQ